jgi:hypothetical protein
MRSLRTSAPAVVSLRQLCIPFDSGNLRGMSLSDRRTALARLTRLLLEAADVAAEERDDDER